MTKRKKKDVIYPYREEAGKLEQKLTSPTVIKGILEANDLHFVKKFGQNFLIDENIVAKIADAADLTKDDTVLEVGPGLGTLTRALSERAGQVYTVEIDKKLIPVLMQTLADKENVGIINEDVMKLDFESLLEGSGKLKIAANLPYYISTPVIMSFLESDLPFEQMTFLVQKEVADRLAASPGSKAYGSLSLAAQYYADVDVPFTVPAGVFMPKPNVDSAVVRLKKKEETIESDKKLFFQLVRAGFANRRKTLYNSLKSNLPYGADTVRELLERADINPSVRAETLSADDFAKMSLILREMIGEDE